MTVDILPSSQCKWLWLSPERNESEINQYAHFRDSFSACPEEGPVALSISADSQYEVWLNGSLVARGQYADYPDYKVYDTWDISTYVEEENVLCILVYYQGRSSSCYRHGKPGVLFEVSQQGEDEHWIPLLSSSGSAYCRRAAEYRCGDMEMISGQLGFVFEYNANYDDGWRKRGYDPQINNGKGNPWHSAAAFQNFQRLYPRPIQKLIIGKAQPVTLRSQGIFRMAPEEGRTTAARMQQAYLSFRSLQDMTNPSLRGPVSLDGKGALPFRSPADNLYLLLDLGKEESGYLHLDITTTPGTEIQIAYGEHLEDLRVRAEIGGRNFSGRYISAGGRERFTYYNKRLGGRYLQMFVHAKEFTLHYAGLLPANYPLTQKGKFHCSDSLHNRIYQVGLRSLQLCMHEHYEDCPWREQALYAMDSRTQMLCGYYAFGEYTFARESLRLLALGQRKDGLLELCAPAEVPITIPSFSFIWVKALEEYVLYSGDREFGKEMMDCVERLIRSFWISSRGGELLQARRGPQYWNFYEWAPGLDGEPYGDYLAEDKAGNQDGLLNAFYKIALDAATRLCKWLDETDPHNHSYSNLAAWCEMLADNVKASFHKTFWDEERQAYASYLADGIPTHYSELLQALVLSANLCPDSVKDRLTALLAKEETLYGENAELIPCTQSHCIFKYEALLSQGDRYSEFVFREVEEKWGAMLFQGATSFWETERGAADFDNAGSLCHGWSAVPVYLYYKYILGIAPILPGFQDYQFQPCQSSILAAEGTIPTPNASFQVHLGPDGMQVKRQ